MNLKKKKFKIDKKLVYCEKFSIFPMDLKLESFIRDWLDLRSFILILSCIQLKIKFRLQKVTKYIFLNFLFLVYDDFLIV